MNKVVEIPSSFSASDEWHSLGDEQRLSLLRRLDNAKALGESLYTGKRLAESSDFADFLEDLELDVALLQELDSARQGGLSRWQIHNSWSFETSPSEMHQSLPPALESLADAYEPQRGDPINAYIDWLKASGRNLVLVVNEFSAAKSYPAALAIHVLLDVLLTRILLACYKLRLNPEMPR